MNGKQFRKYLDRDHGCLHCGDRETAVPQHRRNRGMGGSKLLHRASNIIVLCAHMNGLIESNAHYAEAARSKGWKLTAGEEPESTPVWDAQLGCWWLLDNEYGRELVAANVEVP